MAPRFKQNMYQTYETDNGADAIVCFPFTEDKSVFALRDEIAKDILSNKNLYLSKSEGEPTILDSWFRFSDVKDKVMVEAFFAEEYPGFFSSLFKTKKWRDYNNQSEKVNKLVKFELSTSHDHTCIEVFSLIHSEFSLSRLIETAAKNLQIDMVKNASLPNMADIIMTNKTFIMK
ncbi:MAG: hypothetical protein PHV17_09110 [Candidatus Omnitrophica bacterium]|nr:hypothetical protein [Candidatus Omnitrophota bacterium]